MNKPVAPDRLNKGQGITLTQLFPRAPPRAPLFSHSRHFSLPHCLLTWQDFLLDNTSGAKKPEFNRSFFALLERGDALPPLRSARVHGAWQRDSRGISCRWDGGGVFPQGNGERAADGERHGLVLLPAVEPSLQGA